MRVFTHPQNSRACQAYLGPPYLYVTFHGGSHKGIRGDVNSVYKYSRDGYLLGEVCMDMFIDMVQTRAWIGAWTCA